MSPEAWCTTRSGRLTGCRVCISASAGIRGWSIRFRARSSSVRVEVQRRTLIHWNGEPVSAFEVVQHARSITARTWVRSDGVILRQEVPFPIVRLVLDRRPEQPARTETKEQAHD